MKDKLILIYSTKEQNNIRLLGDKFYEQNEKKFKLLINGKKIKNRIWFYNNNKKILNIKVVFIPIKKITDLSYMFYGCTQLTSVISKWNISNIIDISFIFSNCFLLKKIENLSNWNTSMGIGGWVLGSGDWGVGMGWEAGM